MLAVRIATRTTIRKSIFHQQAFSHQLVIQPLAGLASTQDYNYLGYGGIRITQNEAKMAVITLCRLTCMEM